MDLVPFFLLPLVGGYAFASSRVVTRYRFARNSGHHLYFKAVLYGTIPLAAAAVKSGGITRGLACHAGRLASGDALAGGALIIDPRTPAPQWQRGALRCRKGFSRLLNRHQVRLEAGLVAQIQQAVTAGRDA
ncbi:hypothetical protein CKO40_09265 [Halochromatium glycolicum]|uniref:Uncharacterized protein n=1 Tax=Halochromatium glycolicum TaxID=85075 RepID=A0AAJ0X9E1_9GAMM|nr:hypothetical protein [Halochromatium glycolicum]